MFPFGFIVGAMAGAAGAFLFGRELVEHGRPLAKAALKATLSAMHEAQVRGAEIGEAAEDLYAEAKAEVTEEVFKAAMAAAAAKAAEMAAAKKAGPRQPEGAEKPAAEAAAASSNVAPSSIRRSRVGSAND